MATKEPKAHSNDDHEEVSKETCGVVMPIAAFGDYAVTHWEDVLGIVTDAVVDAGLSGNLVSYADETTVIQKTIVQNLYDNPLVICDVSGKNPNVMFELGLRLAFDKPTIIIKDDATPYSFDTGPIEHLSYPKDLRFTKIVEFKSKLTSKIKATLAASKAADYSTFLKHFGKFTVAKLDEKEISGQEYIVDALKDVQSKLAKLQFESARSSPPYRPRRRFVVNLGNTDPTSVTTIRREIEQMPDVSRTAVHLVGGKAELFVEIEGAGGQNLEVAMRRVSAMTQQLGLLEVTISPA